MLFKKINCEVMHSEVDVANGFCELGGECGEVCPYGHGWDATDDEKEEAAITAFQEAARDGEYGSKDDVM